MDFGNKWLDVVPGSAGMNEVIVGTKKIAYFWGGR